MIFYYIPPSTVKDIKKRLEQIDEELEEVNRNHKLLVAERDDLKEELNNLQPNFYFDTIYTRKDFDDRYILTLCDNHNYVRLYNIATQYHWVKDTTSGSVITETGNRRNRKYITYDTMNFITDSKADEFKPLEDEE